MQRRGFSRLCRASDCRGNETGGEIKFVEANNKVVIKLQTDKERLAEGYRGRAERSRQLAEKMPPASSEATGCLGESPDGSG